MVEWLVDGDRAWSEWIIKFSEFIIENDKDKLFRLNVSRMGRGARIVDCLKNYILINLIMIYMVTTH